MFGFVLVTNQLLGQKKPRASIKGHIENANTGEPLPGVNILFERTMMGTTTDVNGNYFLNKIPIGRYSVKVTMMGYKSKISEVEITPDKTAVLNFKLPETILETDALVVTATKRRQALQDSPNSLALVTSKDIERTNEAYLDESLKYAPGVYFTVSNINIRGSSGFSRGAGSRVLFMVDGIPMMPGDSGDIKWDVMPVTQVQQVEIVKGAGSALYGSFALGGIVNIISKEPSDKPETHIRIASGIYDEPYWPEWRWTDRTLHFNQIDLSHSRSWKNTHVLLSAGKFQTTGYKVNGHQNKWNLLGKITHQFNPQTTLILNGRLNIRRGGEIILWKNQHDALKVSEKSVGNEVHSHKLNLSSIFKKVVSKRLAYQLRAAYLKNRWENHFYDNNDYSDAHNLRLELQTDFQLTPKHVLTGGIENVYDNVEANIFGNHDAMAWAIYLQDEYKLFKGLTATLGLRYDHHQIDGEVKDNELSPKVGLVYRPSALTSVRASIGRGFRAPTVAEMFTRTIVSGFKVEPNENLKAERAWSYEVGINQIISENLLVDFAYFRNDYWDLIEGEPDSTQTIHFENLTRARIRGAELNLKSRWWKQRLGFNVNYTYLSPRDLILDEVLAYRAKHMVTFSFNLNFDLVGLNFDYRYISRYEDVKVYPKDERVPQKVLDGKIFLAWHQYKLSFDVDNILQYHYVMVERNIAPIRRYMLTLSGNF